MDDVKARLKTAELELEKVEQRRAATFKRISASTKRAQAVLEYAEKELKRALSETSPERREQLTQLNELRRQGALTNLEMLQMLGAMDVSKPIAPAIVKRVDDLCLRTQWITMEFNLRNYKSTMSALEVALGLVAAPAAEATKAPTGPLRTGTGNLGRPAVPGVPRPPVGVPPRPPAPGGKTAPLPARPAVPGVPAGAMPARPSLPPRPTAPGMRPPVGGTGPLAGRPGLGRPVGSGPLKNAAHGAAEAQAKLIADLQAASEDEDTRLKLRTLHDRVQELETSLAPLRGDLPGELGIDLVAAAVHIRQIAGKVYFVNRTLAGLPPELANRIPFESRDFDPGVMEVLDTIAPDDENASGPRPADGQETGVSIAGRLKSLFKS